MISRTPKAFSKGDHDNAMQHGVMMISFAESRGVLEDHAVGLCSRKRLQKWTQ